MRLKNNTRQRKKSIQGLRSFKDSLPKNIKETIFKKAKIYSTGNYVEGLGKGDEIYFDKHAGYGIEYKNKYFQVIKENDVVVVL